MAQIKWMQDFKEFLSLLNSARIEYLLIGGYAVNLHGYHRATKDMDVWIATKPQNLSKLIDVLVQFGFKAGSLRPEDFTGEQSVFRMGVPPCRLELLTRISGVDFDSCHQRRVMMNVDGIDVPVISYEDLKQNKISSDRLKDKADVEELERKRR
jgi:hypothetical protein